MKEKNPPLVGIIMGSDSDWPTMESAYQVCREFNVPCEVRVVSAHRTPDDMAQTLLERRERTGISYVCAGAHHARDLAPVVGLLAGR